MQTLPKILCAWLAVALWVAATDSGRAQYGTSNPPAPSLLGTPGAAATPPAGAAAPNVLLQTPQSDPYSTAPSGSLYSLPPPPASPYGTGTPAYGSPYGTGVAAPQPGTLGQPYGFTQPNPVPYSPGQAAASPYGYGQPSATPYYPPSGTAGGFLGFGNQSPPLLFPNGLFGQGQPGQYQAPTGSPLKLFQHVRISHDFLYGNSSNDLALQIDDTFVTTTVAMPNFMWTGQPWFLSPGFGLHNWSGPFDGNVAHDLPANAYSAFVDVGWASNPNQLFGAELGGRIGVFTDFMTYTPQSLRPSGTALMRLALTPTTTAVKAGVSYINRADIKLLPAFGILWTPNQQTHWDLFFPQPKLSSYLTTLGNRELWWYVGGEYGGGAWTVQAGTPDGSGKRPKQLMDINDIRVFLGLQMGPPASSAVGQLGAFIEVGYVFDRHVVFVATPADSYGLKDTFMVRGGLAF